MPLMGKRQRPAFQRSSRPEPQENIPSEAGFIIQAEQLGKHVATANGRLDILTGVNLAIKAGESVAIVGASGSGKSTLLGLLAGLDVPSEGRIWLAGDCLTDFDEDGRAGLRGRYVGFVFQSFQLLPHLSALENVMLPLELNGASNAHIRALAMLCQVGLSERTRHYPRQLSGGEQQRVALARAFVTTPAILFADEPTGNLDSQTGNTVIDLLFDLNREQHTTLVLVTHDAGLAVRCSRRLRLDSGRIVAGD
jgi:putative ABC transport system ATP-binding protein